MVTTTNIILNKEEFKAAIQESIEANTSEIWLKMFHHEIDSKTALGIIGKHRNTLTKLIKTKELVPVSGDKSKYMFRLSDVLNQLIK